MSSMSGPLAGRRIVVTRAADQAADFCRRLCDLGAVPICLPTIEVVSLPAPELDVAMGDIGRFDWLLFTSTNAVRIFFERFSLSQETPVLPSLAAVGPITAKALRERGYTVDEAPDEYTGEALALCLGDLTDKRILLPRARKGRPEIVKALLAEGAQVDDIALYDTAAANPDLAVLAQLADGVDALTFTSPSTATNFFAMIEPAAVASAVVACIGPTTAQAVEQLGITVDVVPRRYTVDGLLDALVAYYE